MVISGGLLCGAGDGPVPTPAYAPANDTALQQTQSMLQSPTDRAKAIQGNASAQAADDQAHALGGSAAGTEAIYSLTSDILADLARQANGDPVKMQELLQQAMANPEAFAANLSDRNKAQLRAIAGKMATPAPAPALAPPAKSP